MGLDLGHSRCHKENCAEPAESEMHFGLGFESVSWIRGIERMRLLQIFFILMYSITPAPRFLCDSSHNLYLTASLVHTRVPVGYLCRVPKAA